MITTKSTNSLDLIDSVDSASALLSPIRLQMLQHLKEPNSATGLAKLLDLPRQKVNYHLRELEKRGLVQLVSEKKKGNCVERIVKAKARSYLLNFDPVGNLPEDPSEIKDKFSSTYLIAMASKLIKDVATLQKGAEEAKKQLATFSLETEVRFSSAESLAKFTNELTAVVASLANKYNEEASAAGRSYRFCLGAHPVVKK